MARVNRKELIYLLTPIVANTYFVLGANALAHSFTQNKIFQKLTRIDNKIDNNCLKKRNLHTCWHHLLRTATFTEDSAVAFWDVPQNAER